MTPTLSRLSSRLSFVFFVMTSLWEDQEDLMPWTNWDQK